MRRWVWSCGLVLITTLGGSAAAQETGEENAAGDPMGRATEYGLRMTPGMARAISRAITREVFVRRYELDEAKVDQAAELMARRIMQAAHEHEEAAQELIEFGMTTALEYQAKRREGEMEDGIPKDLARGIGARILPLMPSVRELTNGVMQDVRPMLSFKQQLKFTGEIAMVNVALDALEKNMRKWSAGEVDPYGNPFEDPDAELKKDADGQAKMLKTAQRSAEARSKQVPGSEWDAYAKAAKEYYGMDETQAAAVDSLVRDYKARAMIALGTESEWRAKVYSHQFWNVICMDLPGRWMGNPLHIMLNRGMEKLRAPVEALGEELKGRIDEVPTQAQREAAEARVAAAFAARGLKMEEMTRAVDAPPAGGEGAP